MLGVTKVEVGADALQHHFFQTLWRLRREVIWVCKRYLGHVVLLVPVVGD